MSSYRPNVRSLVVPNTYYPDSPTSSSSSGSSNELPAPQPRCQMHLHNMKKQGNIDYFESAVASGPRERELWVATVTITWSWNGYGLGTYQGQALRKQAAREQASLFAVEGLGIDPYALK
ncbi:hypothetical protein FRB94_000777 [Tulasnella sp. JGI-2019a]|nr:hypothetical protein FRB93_002672 [Tulasnella sp. JGI-2019a]KAG9013797.1 hypothetical protein FRB94_000777 [Tulasnella sp. JGI-2019a]KAG9038826.1 hypothetical protein FRB95_014375 [Tulasnella sp. JGI-2019a]